jgi:hypothetical protein
MGETAARPFEQARSIGERQVIGDLENGVGFPKQKLILDA